MAVAIDYLLVWAESGLDVTKASNELPGLSLNRVAANILCDLNQHGLNEVRLVHEDRS